ncbi:hypothetical protein F3Y22_tig00110556pilonHSYRG00392 [Hibiscus syriacus]|uniref:Uncharacterized protein n=1 Tax=Hibiscus syriacus TaxID=106335 RepID=A0A6A3A880_HIBSY|nr:hypothetical protein F3Y22_tig00110556pilonHSYRG00392 [Hibiscus syriacus]
MAVCILEQQKRQSLWQSLQENAPTKIFYFILMMFISSSKVVTLDATDNKVEFDKSTHQLLQPIIIQFLHIYFQRYAKTVKDGLCITDSREKRQDIDTTGEHVSSRSSSRVWFLGKPRSISTSSGSSGATLFLPTHTRFHFQHSSRTYFWTLECGSLS